MIEWLYSIYGSVEIVPTLLGLNEVQAEACLPIMDLSFLARGHSGCCLKINPSHKPFWRDY